jgi:speckle-type POZ protein
MIDGNELKEIIKISQIEEDLIQIEWTIKVTRSAGIEEQTFQLNHFRNNVPKFAISCKYSQPTNDFVYYIPPTCHTYEEREEHTYPFQIELSLIQPTEHQQNFGGNSLNKSSLNLDYYSRPSAVWASANGTKKIILEAYNSNEWTSEKIYLNFAQQGSCWRPSTLKCIFWMRFFGSVGFTNAHRQLIDLYVKQMFCDVHFFFGENEDEDDPIGGHLCVLSARSPVFEAMFKYNMKESNLRKVIIKEMNPKIFKELLHYMYAGQFSEILCEEKAHLLFTAADRYDIVDLRDECANILMKCINLSNAIKLLIWADEFSIRTVKEAALTFMAKNGREVCKTGLWGELINHYPDLAIVASQRMVELCHFSHFK